MADGIKSNVLEKLLSISNPAIVPGDNTNPLLKPFPGTIRGNAMDNLFSFTLFFDTDSQSAKSTIFKFVRALSVDAMSTSNNDSLFGRNLICGISKETVEGNPSTPSLKISQNAMWRFRWVVPIGTRTISIKCKQAINISPRPTMTIKANPNVGINSDLITFAPSGTDWVTIGPVSFTTSAAGVIYIELSNNIMEYTNDTLWGGSDGVNTYFDHIVVT